MKIKVILWDIDGTLLNFEAAEKAAIRQCFSAFDLGECTDEMLGAYQTINREYWKRLEIGDISKKEALVARFHDLLEKYGLDTSVAPQVNAEYQVRLGDTICFNKNGLETVKVCKGKIPQYAVTNGTKVAQDRKLKNSKLDTLFDGIFISDVLGVEKPNKEFFDKVFEAIGNYEKDEVIIVGDSLTSDIKGGNNAGILTAWYNPKRIENAKNVNIDFQISNLWEIEQILQKLT